MSTHPFFKRKAYLYYKLIFWVILFVPGYYLVQNLQIISQRFRVLQEATSTEGIIENVVLLESGKKSNPLYYLPTVIYKIPKGDADSSVIITELDKSTYNYAIGEVIDLLYFPEKPNKAWHNNYSALFHDAGTTAFLILAFGAIFGSFVYMSLRKFFML